jgi:hypothetical protein
MIQDTISPEGTQDQGNERKRGDEWNRGQEEHNNNMYGEELVADVASGHGEIVHHLFFECVVEPTLRMTSSSFGFV